MLLSFAVLVFVILTAVCTQQTATRDASGDSSTRPETKVKVTYIANEGVLIESKQKRVLIDGLHRFYKAAYAFPPDDLRILLEGARDPYDRIDLVLVSHLHGDHFHPQSAGLHLINNSQARLAVSGQIIDEIKKNFPGFKRVEKRIDQVPYQWKTSSNAQFDGIKVRFLGLRHANERFKWIENLGHLVEIGGKKFLHIGDADMTDENFSAFELSEEDIDVAFIPYWFLMSEDGRNLVRKQFDPKHIVAVHVSPDGAEKVKEELRKLDPEITVFTRILESRAF